MHAFLVHYSSHNDSALRRDLGRMHAKLLVPGVAAVQSGLSTASLRDRLSALLDDHDPIGVLRLTPTLEWRGHSEPRAVREWLHRAGLSA